MTSNTRVLSLIDGDLTEILKVFKLVFFFFKFGIGCVIMGDCEYSYSNSGKSLTRAEGWCKTATLMWF